MFFQEYVFEKCNLGGHQTTTNNNTKQTGNPRKATRKPKIWQGQTTQINQNSCKEIKKNTEDLARAGDRNQERPGAPRRAIAFRMIES